ncbi:MAG: protein-methionine-sulfoxide reductase catalytic subunit MsrP [Pseudomonadota bacterium]
MKLKDIKSSEITPESLYLKRREFLSKSINTGLVAGTAIAAPGLLLPSTAQAAALESVKRPSAYDTDEEVTDEFKATSYNNFYEFGTGKNDPVRYSKDFKVSPWTVEIAGEAEKTGKFTLEDILKPHPLEERIYRLRCVEAWSMVIPWVGFSLGDLLKRFQPTSNAKYVEFTTLLDPKQMPGQRSRFGSIDWPYVEGLRIDEAMNPLAMISVGMYGKVLPNQNGAPLRLIVPWKYGFKSIKSIAKIRFTSREPKTSWNKTAANEYGFYANVNPEVSHPRWSQAKERRIGDFFKRETLMFNGYAEHVADLYKDMNLAKYY